MILKDLKNELHAFSNEKTAQSTRRFFTGEHGEKDQFIGVKVPQVRILAKKYHALSLEDCEKLLSSPMKSDSFPF